MIQESRSRVYLGRKPLEKASAVCVRLMNSTSFSIVVGKSGPMILEELGRFWSTVTRPGTVRE